MKLVKDEKLKEMSNLLKKDTGLSHDLWLDDAGSTRKIGHHEPRLKVKVGGEYIPVAISKNPYVIKSKISIPNFDEVVDWIVKHYDTLIRCWELGRIDKEAMDELTGTVDKSLNGENSTKPERKGFDDRDSIEVKGIGQLERVYSDEHKIISFYKDSNDNQYLFIKGKQESYIYTRLTVKEISELQVKHTQHSISDIILSHLGNINYKVFVSVKDIVREFDIDRDMKYFPDGDIIHFVESYKLSRKRFNFCSKDYIQGYLEGYKSVDK